MLPSSIIETTLTVTDLERSIEFYNRVFQHPVMIEDEHFCAYNINGSQVLLLFLEGSNPQGSDIPTGGHIPAHGARGQSHVGFAVPADSLDEWRAHLHDLSITIESQFTWPRGGISVYFRDPDGHLLELLTPGVWPSY